MFPHAERSANDPPGISFSTARRSVERRRLDHIPYRFIKLDCGRIQVNLYNPWRVPA